MRPSSLEDWERLFDRALGSDKPGTWLIECLRHRLPFNMGSKAETFCREDLGEGLTEKVLSLFLRYDYPLILETKSHLVGLVRYTDLLKKMKVAVIVAQMGGSDTLAYQLEPGCAPPSMRWELVRQLNLMGIWTAVRWEPILMGINSSKDALVDFAEKAQRYGAQHVCWYNYRTSDPTAAFTAFESRGFDYAGMVEKNEGPAWIAVGETFVGELRSRGVPQSSPDFVNFPLSSDRESCCGVDGLFSSSYQFTLQHACAVIRQKGSVSWEDMEAVTFRHSESYNRLKRIWNGKHSEGYYTLADARGIVVLDKDGQGQNVYSSGETNREGRFF